MTASAGERRGVVLNPSGPAVLAVEEDG